MSYPATFDTIGQPFILLTTVDSTNNYAMAQAHAGMATPGTAYFALEQTAGKGQRGKTWKSQPGQNIIMSLNLSPGKALIDKFFMLSASVSLACYDFYKTLAGQETSIKWPNDLYWRDRKAGGILIENIIGQPDKSWKCSVAGIGININQTEFGDFSHRAVSLRQITGKEESVTMLGKELCIYVQNRMNAFYAGDYLQILEDYNQALFMRGQKVKLKQGSIVFQTTITAVDMLGQLIVSDTLERSFGFGEIEWVFS
ncbi:biotin--[acetyl-CoA-carboxylase] ligase [Flavitalea sp.]|nr:biotin--[acetyl-CoA-carboxylase] ligase [Flavitalea sp.]